MNRSTLVLLAAVCIPLAGLGVVALHPGSGPGPRGVSGALESPPTFRVVGLMTNAPVRASGPDAMEELAFYGTFSRTRLALELVHPGRNLIGLEHDASRVEELRDDEGMDLLDPSDPFGPIERMPRLAEDGRSLVFVLGSKRMPSPGATRLSARGTLAVRVADELVGHETEGVRLVKGTTFRLGPWTFEVVESEATPWGEDGWTTTLETRDDPSAIVAWTLVGEDGTEVEWTESFTMEGGGLFQRGLQSQETPTGPFTVRVEAWKNPELVRIPFEVEAGLGLR